MERSTIDDLDAFVRANGDLEAVEAFITDPNGVARGKCQRARSSSAPRARTFAAHG